MKRTSRGLRSNTKQDAFNKEAGTKTEAFLRNEFMPAVIADLQNELSYDVNCYIEDDDPQTVVFAYNRSFDDSAILPVIRLEIGALAVWILSGRKANYLLCRRAVWQTFQATEH